MTDPTADRFDSRAFVAFVALAFGLTWLLLIPAALSSRHLIPIHVPEAIGFFVGYLPAAAALIVLGATRGRAAVGQLLRRLLIWRVRAVWYLVALLLIPGIFVLGIFLYHLLSGTQPFIIKAGPLLPVAFLINLVIVGLLNGEEIAWRGYALPHLQERYNALTASLILGTIEAVFHAPLFFTKGASQSSIPPLGFLLLSVADAVLFTWLFNNSRGSLLLVYMLHASQNAGTNVFPVPNNGPAFWVIVGILALAAALVAALEGPEHLSRRRTRQLLTYGEDVDDDAGHHSAARPRTGLS